ncbi:MAG: hypothetical protein AB8H80_12000 [Planctomycetota bacterium]
MTRPASLLGCGLVDERGIAGTRGIARSWAELDTKPPGTGRTIKELFGKTDTTFRRIDLPAKALVLACEAADILQLLDEDERQETAICIETDLGSLHTDVSFASSLDDECVHAGIFPYSLTSTCLGEVALRYGLRGPTVSMSVRDGVSPAGAGLREALRMLACGDVQHVITGTVDVLLEAANGMEPKLRAIIAVLSAADGGIDKIGWPVPAQGPYDDIVRHCR